MAGTSSHSDHLSLPKGWPRRVRSSVIHSISLAQVSLTLARARAIAGIEHGRHPGPERERLAQEITLLREEMRIKDARMETIPAPRRDRGNGEEVDGDQVLGMVGQEGTPPRVRSSLG
jgi:hypothetical protein